MRVKTVQASEWREYREVRLAALKDAPSAFASTWQQEAARSPEQWRERAELSQNGLSQTIVVAVDDDRRWIGLAGGYRPGDDGADAELISMWVSPDCRCRGVGQALARAVVSWAENHGSRVIGLWVNVANHPGISLYERSAFVAPMRLPRSLPIPHSKKSGCSGTANASHYQLGNLNETGCHGV
jgi:ribosomal protein S18 acetylase RimI-like enzyme